MISALQVTFRFVSRQSYKQMTVRMSTSKDPDVSALTTGKPVSGYVVNILGEVNDHHNRKRVAVVKSRKAIISSQLSSTRSFDSSPGAAVASGTSVPGLAAPREEPTIILHPYRTAVPAFTIRSTWENIFTMCHSVMALQYKCLVIFPLKYSDKPQNASSAFSPQLKLISAHASLHVPVIILHSLPWQTNMYYLGENENKE